jgi:hypothetical protein
VSDTDAQPRVRDWDPNRPVLSGLLARREDLGAAHLSIHGETVFFNIQQPLHPVTATTPSTEAALAALNSLPVQVREPFDVGALLAEQMSDAEQMLGALRGEPEFFDIPVVTRTQPLVAVEMPEAGFSVRLHVQVRRMPVSVSIAMPLLNADGTQVGPGTNACSAVASGSR